MKSRTHSDRQRHFRALIAGLCAALALLLTPAISARASAGEGVQAHWQPHELRFHYFGLSTYYTCTGLEDRLEQILRELGAHRDVRVVATGCPGPDDISRSQIARIHVRMPAAPAEGAADSFNATRKLVSLKTHNMGNNGAGACELLEQVRDQLLPKLNIQLVKDDLQCVPGQPSHIGRSLQVEALVADANR